MLLLKKQDLSPFEFMLGNAFSRHKLFIIPTLMIPFALFTTFTAQVELSLIYLPTIMPLILRLGFDRITAAAIVLVATISGFTVGLTTPANLGVAQEIAELPFLFRHRIQNNYTCYCFANRNRFCLDVRQKSRGASFLQP